MSGKATVAIAFVTSVLSICCWEFVRRGEKEQRTESRPTTEETLDALALRSVPVENDDVFRAAGVYVWRLKLGLPSTPHQIAIRYSTADGEKQIIPVTVPAKRGAGPEVTEIMVVLRFDGPDVGQSAKLTCTLTAGAERRSTFLDNPYQGFGQSTLSATPSSASGQVRLMEFATIPDGRWYELGLVILPKSE